MAAIEWSVEEIGALAGLLEREAKGIVDGLLSRLASAALPEVSSLLTDAQAKLAGLSAAHAKLTMAAQASAPPESESVPDAESDVTESPTVSLPAVPAGSPDESLMMPSLPAPEPPASEAQPAEAS